jgi:hypothetical protein
MGGSWHLGASSSRSPRRSADHSGTVESEEPRETADRAPQLSWARGGSDGRYGTPALTVTPTTRRVQHHPQEPQHRLIAHPRRHFRQYDVMPYRVEIGFQVQIDDVCLPLKDGFRNTSDRGMRGLSRPIAVRSRLEVSLCMANS